jgi:hypothetical protein
VLTYISTLHSLQPAVATESSESDLHWKESDHESHRLMRSEVQLLLSSLADSISARAISGARMRL